MRSILLLFMTVAAAVAMASTPPPASTPSPAPASPRPSPPAASPGQAPAAAPVTRSFGQPPESLAGTWLLSLSTPSKQGLINNWHIYRIARRGGQWSLQRYERPNPSPLDAAVAEAKQRQAAFEPSATAIKAIKAVLPQLTLLPEGETFQAVVLRSGDQIPADPPPPPVAKDAKLSIEILDRSKQANVISAVSFYAKEVKPDQINGDTHSVTIAAAGFSVVPIELFGTFRMYRLE